MRIICLDSDPPPIQSSFACRSDGGLAHLDCLIEKAVSQQAHRGNEVWYRRQTCGQDFTGAMLTGLLRRRSGRVCATRRRRAQSGFWPSTILAGATFAMGIMRRRCGSTGRCLA